MGLQVLGVRVKIFCRSEKIPLITCENTLIICLTMQTTKLTMVNEGAGQLWELTGYRMLYSSHLIQANYSVACERKVHGNKLQNNKSINESKHSHMPFIHTHNYKEDCQLEWRQKKEWWELMTKRITWWPLFWLQGNNKQTHFFLFIRTHWGRKIQ